MAVVKIIVDGAVANKVLVKGLIPAAGSGGGSVDFVAGETPSGLINGSNATFTSAFSFVPESVQVEVNGLGRKRIDDFTTSGNNTINLTFSPVVGDNILIHYIKL